MKKRRIGDPSKKRYSITRNKGGLQIRIRPDFTVKRGQKVRQMIYDPMIHEPRPGDLIVRLD